jgi:hypothetical protein
MTGKTKLLISASELELVTNSEWILTKSKIIARVYELFGEQAEQIRSLLSEKGHLLPEAAVAKSPRIFKGENYKGLPYVILDYPAFFGKQNLFALRTLFWWGNYFSIQLQIAGDVKLQYQDHILKRVRESPGNFFICTSNDQWDHDVKSGNYTPVSIINASDLASLADKPFIKIVLVYDLKEWNNISGTLQSGYNAMLELLTP